MIIVVTKTTATAPITVSSISCCVCGREADSRSSPTPTPRLMATASATPMNIGRNEWPFRLRKARHDADDQGGLETLAQSDQERAEEDALHVHSTPVSGREPLTVSKASRT